MKNISDRFKNITPLGVVCMVAGLPLYLPVSVVLIAFVMVIKGFELVDEVVTGRS